jgi:hypothetical protein
MDCEANIKDKLSYRFQPLLQKELRNAFQIWSIKKASPNRRGFFVECLYMERLSEFYVYGV